jgi:excisionase family DNA binding protein
MSLGKTWYTVEEAAEKFGIAHEQILAWIAEGAIRTENVGRKVVNINSDDLNLKIQQLTGI